MDGVNKAETNVSLRTPVCDVLGIEHPLVQGPLGGPWDVSAELVAAVSRAGALGSIAAAMKTATQVREQIRRVRELAGGRPFAVNHTRRPFAEDAFSVTLDERPPVISFALGDPGDCVARAHEAGSVFMAQVTTLEQAHVAAEAGVDVIVAQGGEGGGFSGSVGTIALVPEVVDAVSPVPVLAAGGIADGRGLAAALALGAQGVNVGTRFLAASEAAIPDDWKGAIVSADSAAAVKVDFADLVTPALTEGGWHTVPRSLKTPFVAEWLGRGHELEAHAADVRRSVQAAMEAQRLHEYLPLAGQSAGLVREILPAADIVRSIVGEAALVLSALPRATTTE